MTTPDIPNSLQFHAGANVSDATPPIVTGAVGLSNPAVLASVIRNGAGDWQINLFEGIDQLDRKFELVADDAAHGTLQLDPADVADTTQGVFGFIDGGASAYVAGDMNWQFTCWRVAIFLG